MIETTSLTKYYRKRKGVADLDLKIEKGSIYGFLGCNGAGKTTTLCIFAGLVKKTRGIVTIDGKDLDKQENEIKKIMGIMPQNMLLYPNKTSFQNMLFYAKLKGMKKNLAVRHIESLFGEFNLKEIRNVKAKELSHGQSKLILILQAFLNSPKVVILDEPISGFDPKKIIMLRNFIKKKRSEQTIIISSHNLDEVDRLCTHIAIIHEGRLVLQGKKEEIKKGRSLEKVFIENI